MIRKPEHKTIPITINLDGPDGNAFMLLGLASRYAKELERDGSSITNEMTLGDYTHLVKTFDKHFGDIVVLETTNSEIIDAIHPNDYA